MSLSTHVLDAVTGRPAPDLALTVEQRDGSGAWQLVGHARTDADGRARDLLDADRPAAVYRLTFDTGAFFAAAGRDTFYPEVSVVFTVSSPGDHHHVPLLLSPFAYSTYRGS
ncbi:hydroxyisourate hydrolase [Actinomycetospora sp. OC33-EN08]|uniref:5-hydroxyisourate hydrolase n=1 Tax=Actinomycetospora aurantiaca TaxID=3129233 RepID=A0ABU8MH46_9PSEU